MFDAQFVYGPSVARRAFLRETWHEASPAICALAAALVIGIAGALTSAFRLPFVFIVGFVCYPWYHIALDYVLVGRKAKAGQGTVALHFADDAVTGTSAFGELAMPWSVLRASHLTRSFLLLKSPKLTIPVPRSALSDDAIVFVQERLNVARLLSEGGVPPA